MTSNFKSTLTINKLKESEVLEEFVKATQASEITPAMSPLLRKTSMDGNHHMQKSLVSPKLQSRAQTMINGRMGNNTQMTS